MMNNADGMMDGMGIMMVGMGLVWLLVVLLLVLGIAALLKYLFFTGRQKKDSG
jgi:hypothetical protein